PALCCSTSPKPLEQCFTVTNSLPSAPSEGRWAPELVSGVSCIHVACKRMWPMRNYDFAPLTRSTVGFDRVFDLLDSAFTASQTDEGYPPYNIVKTGETSYRIELAVAGFGPGDLSIVAQENVLTVSGSRNSSQQQLYLHHGIASRAFERRFNLADYVKVANADLVNGLLTIDLVREIPEAMRPRQIQIGGNAQKPEQIEQAAA